MDILLPITQWVYHSIIYLIHLKSRATVILRHLHVLFIQTFDR